VRPDGQGKAKVRRQRFAMIRSFHLADVFTIANGCCGVGSVFHAMRWIAHEERWNLFVLLPLALVFDVLDGRIARWRHRASPMGRELDSLADVISFGVAPVAIAFAVGLTTALDQAMLIYFVVCGVSRLARYNITAERLADGTGKVDHFEGTPIPTSLVPLGLMLLAAHADLLLPVSVGPARFHLASLLFVISGSLMISTVRIPKP
jgi:CDP-diacylglycerol--serine O-phosphatidyltransferase